MLVCGSLATPSHTGVESELKKVQATIAVLRGERTFSTKTKHPRRRGLNRIEVTASVKMILKAQGSLTEPALRKTMLEHAAKEGRSGAGLHFVLRKVLKHGAFESNGQRWNLMTS